jgi:hypothetical protein
LAIADCRFEETQHHPTEVERANMRSRAQTKKPTIDNRQSAIKKTTVKTGGL